MGEMFDKEYSEYATKTPRYLLLLRSLNVKNKCKNSLEKAKNHARKLKKEVMVLHLACKRKDVPWYAKKNESS